MSDQKDGLRMADAQVDDAGCLHDNGWRSDGSCVICGAKNAAPWPGRETASAQSEQKPAVFATLEEAVAIAEWRSAKPGDDGIEWRWIAGWLAELRDLRRASASPATCIMCFSEPHDVAVFCMKHAAEMVTSNASTDADLGRAQTLYSMAFPGARRVPDAFLAEVTRILAHVRAERATGSDHPPAWALVAWLWDRREQYKPSSGTYAAFDELLVAAADGAHVDAWKHGELDDLRARATTILARRSAKASPCAPAAPIDLSPETIEAMLSDDNVAPRTSDAQPGQLEPCFPCAGKGTICGSKCVACRGDGQRFVPTPRTAEAPPVTRTIEEIEEVLGAVEAVIEDGEIDFDDVTSPEKAKAAQLELVGHIRDQLCDKLPTFDAAEAWRRRESARRDDQYGIAVRTLEYEAGIREQEVAALREALEWFADEGHYTDTYRRGAGFVDAVGITHARAGLLGMSSDDADAVEAAWNRRERPSAIATSSPGTSSPSEENDHDQRGAEGIRAVAGRGARRDSVAGPVGGDPAALGGGGAGRDGSALPAEPVAGVMPNASALVWADEATPFDGAQAKALLDENERLRAALATTAAHLGIGFEPAALDTEMLYMVPEQTDNVLQALRRAATGVSPSSIPALDTSTWAVDYGALDPGIRNLVRWLVSNGFATTDSGDGISKRPATIDNPDGDACAESEPNVYMLVDLDKLVSEADRLLALLGNVSDLLPQIQASYDPLDKTGIIALHGIDDKSGQFTSPARKEKKT